jgi:hypothetical protein
LREEDDDDDFLLLSFVNFSLLGVLVDLLFSLLGVPLDFFASFTTSFSSALSEDFFSPADFFALVLSFFEGAMVCRNFWI